MMVKKSQFMIGLGIGFLTVSTVPAYAGAINLEEAGVPSWILMIFGAVIILLQFVPAMFVFIAFIGTLSLMILKFRRVLAPVKEQKKVSLPCYPATVIKRNRRKTERWEF